MARASRCRHEKACPSESLHAQPTAHHRCPSFPRPPKTSPATPQNAPPCSTATASRRHQARMPDMGVAEAPHLVCVHSTKSSSRSMIARRTRLRVNCTTSERSIWIVLATMDSVMSWGRAGSRQGYNLIHDDHISRYQLPGSRRMERETHHMRHLSTQRGNRSIPSACRNSASIPRHSVIIGIVAAILVVLSLSQSQSQPQSGKHCQLHTPRLSALREPLAWPRTRRCG